MDADKKFWNLRIRKRTWYVWSLRLVWIVWLIFWAEVAIGSWKELEQRAFIISGIIFLASMISGVLLWFLKNKTFKKTE